MILRFSTGNHLSFRDRIDLHFQAGGIKEYGENIHNVSTDGHSFRLLKSLGIFGSNASGKSNLLKSFAFMQNFVQSSGVQSLQKSLIPVQPFRLNNSTEGKPSLFEVVIFAHGSFFRYGFEVSTKSVEKEWLFQADKKKEEFLFIRSNNDFQISKVFREEAQGEVLAKVTRPENLFLSVLANFNSRTALQVVNWFNQAEVIFDFTTVKITNLLGELLHHPVYKTQLHQIINSFPFGFTSIEDELKDIARETNTDETFLKALHSTDVKKFAIKTKHKKYDVNDKFIGYEYFDLAKNESAGTLRFLGLLNPILTALHEKKVLFIDEIDAHLHPNVLVNLVNLFNSNINNSGGAQLIFTSQNTNPLKKGFRRDQMIMMEKNELGVSISSSLYQKMPQVRNDASFEKDYLDSNYVKVPKPNEQLNLFGRSFEGQSEL